MTVFQLDSRLESDTIPVLALELCDVRLLNDRRWPWLVLVPRFANVSELDDLPVAHQTLLWSETLAAGKTLKAITHCEKINTAAIGNIVRQLHVHVIARSAGDANWPGPVWGFAGKQPYNAHDAEQIIEQIRSAFGAKL